MKNLKKSIKETEKKIEELKAQKAILELDTTDPKEISNAILSLAKEKSASRDDMTVYAIKFE